jgi:hypothetical protein
MKLDLDSKGKQPMTTPPIIGGSTFADAQKVYVVNQLSVLTIAFGVVLGLIGGGLALAFLLAH